MQNYEGTSSQSPPRGLKRVLKGCGYVINMTLSLCLKAKLMKLQVAKKLRQSGLRMTRCLVFQASDGKTILVYYFDTNLV